MTQAEAELYWASRDWKKFVVTLESGPQHARVVEVKFVGARSAQRALQAAKANAFRVKTPTSVSVRLATAGDLGCE